MKEQPPTPTTRENARLIRAVVLREDARNLSAALAGRSIDLLSDPQFYQIVKTATNGDSVAGILSVKMSDVEALDCAMQALQSAFEELRRKRQVERRTGETVEIYKSLTNPSVYQLTFAFVDNKDLELVPDVLSYMKRNSHQLKELVRQEIFGEQARYKN